MEMNEVLERLPQHLMSLVIDQPYNEYTPQDHAVWRYVMRQNVRYLPQVAHRSYLEGLSKTGISIDEIPHMYGMNRILKEIGWAAVAVDGFIPPAAFMEFQAYNVLVIAADIRPLDQIEYTPAPDIIHEAAGHAPIIADPEYAEYLRLFGKIGAKAFSSSADHEIYEAIRHLSILKADPYSTKAEIEEGEQKLDRLERSNTTMSEMALIRNLHWWTVEYGLIGDLKKPKIYGAGLLSSIGESYTALQPEVKKLEYTMDAVNYNFDITTRQPQLFVTPDFATLIQVLNEFKRNMALERGGSYGVEKAIESGHTATGILSSGLMMSGTFTELIKHNGSPAYIQLTGPASLAYNYRQLNGHSKEDHPDGFGSPVGKLKNIEKSPELLTEEDLEKFVKDDGKHHLEFESGLKLTGKLIKSVRREGKTILFSFGECLVEYSGRSLFKPDWGVYDMAAGGTVISAFNGPADPAAFGLEYPLPKEKTRKIKHTEEAKRLHGLYREIRRIRDGQEDLSRLQTVFDDALHNHPDEWLILVEMLELSENSKKRTFTRDIVKQLESLKERKPHFSNLIRNGIRNAGA